MTLVTDATLVMEMAPTAKDPYSHIQCLLDGLPDDLTAEQRAHATVFGRPYYRSSLWYSVSSVVCRLSVTFCIVAKRCVLAKKCLKE